MGAAFRGSDQAHSGLGTRRCFLSLTKRNSVSFIGQHLLQTSTFLFVQTTASATPSPDRLRFKNCFDYSMEMSPLFHALSLTLPLLIEVNTAKLLRPWALEKSCISQTLVLNNLISVCPWTVLFFKTPFIVIIDIKNSSYIIGMFYETTVFNCLYIFPEVKH